MCGGIGNCEVSLPSRARLFGSSLWDSHSEVIKVPETHCAPGLTPIDAEGQTMCYC